MSYIKLQNWLISLTWINGIFSFLSLRYSSKSTAWSNAHHTWRKNRKRSKRGMEVNWQNTVRKTLAEEQTPAPCEKVTVFEMGMFCALLCLQS